MSYDINKQACVFLAPLDTVLAQPASRYEPLLRFFALLNYHLVVTDTQLLDNQLFRDDKVTRNLGWLLQEESGDGLPFLLVSQRNADQTLLEILLESMARAGKGGSSPPMRFSSLSGHQRARLHELWQQGKVTESSLQTEVGYPVAAFARRAAKIVREAGYAKDLTWPAEVKKPQLYFDLFNDVLKCKSLPFQAGIQTSSGQRLLTRTIEKFRNFDAANFSRTMVYQELDRMNQGNIKTKGSAKVTAYDHTKVIQAVRAMADYAYLRNFADRSGFSFLLDNVHWRASRVVNKELQVVRPSADGMDDVVMRCLDLQEQVFDGFGSSGHETLSTLLRRCGFAATATWPEIIALRREVSFWGRLDAIGTSTGTKECAPLIREHLRYCFSKLLGKKFDLDNFVSNIFVGVIGLGSALAVASSPLWSSTTLAHAAVGFATAGGGSVLILRALHEYRNRRQVFFIDEITNSVVAEFERRRNQ